MRIAIVEDEAVYQQQLREYLAKYRPRNAAKLVCVGTPHYGSKLADLALVLGFPWSGIVFPPLWALRGRARRKLTTPEIPGLKIGVIASKNNALFAVPDMLIGFSNAKLEAFSNTSALSIGFDDIEFVLLLKYLEGA